MVRGRTVPLWVPANAEMVIEGFKEYEAIRDFLSFAYHQWRRPSPRYVLLLGDANHDPRRFNPASQPSPMPSPSVSGLVGVVP